MVVPILCGIDTLYRYVTYTLGSDTGYYIAEKVKIKNMFHLLSIIALIHYQGFFQDFGQEGSK